MEDEWTKMLGGYNVPYDPRPTISRLASDTTNERAWDELFENLHHQGDIGEASYASVPILVETFRNKPRPWQFYFLVAIVESERSSETNPVVPDWLGDSYKKSIQDSKEFALNDMRSSTEKELIQGTLAVVALASDMIPLGMFVAQTTEDEIEEIIGKYKWNE